MTSSWRGTTCSPGGGERTREGRRLGRWPNTTHYLTTHSTARSCSCTSYLTDEEGSGGRRAPSGDEYNTSLGYCSGSSAGRQARERTFLVISPAQTKNVLPSVATDFITYLTTSHKSIVILLVLYRCVSCSFYQLDPHSVWMSAAPPCEAGGCKICDKDSFKIFSPPAQPYCDYLQHVGARPVESQQQPES